MGRQLTSTRRTRRHAAWCRCCKAYSKPASRLKTLARVAAAGVDKICLSILPRSFRSIPAQLSPDCNIVLAVCKACWLQHH